MKRIIKLLSSVKITVVCLLLLFILTFWGTVAQVEHGLYAAQERYFFSFLFKIFGVLPFPGAQLVLWVLFVNLIASWVAHLRKIRGWRSWGLKISHAGILFYLISAYVVFHVAQESHVHLMEGEGTNVSSSYHEWELAYWKETGHERKVTAYDVTHVRPGDSLAMGEVTVVVEQFFANCAAFKIKDGKKRLIINESGIDKLEKRGKLPEREKNIAGGIFRIGQATILLCGAETTPTKIGDRYFILRHKRWPLPFVLRLKEFKVSFHPSTSIAKSYESLVEIIKDGVHRDVRIYMNNPLREKEYAFYQASYQIDARGREYSTLAVVRNSGQWLPYLACLMVLVGLSMHFLTDAIRRKRT